MIIHYNIYPDKIWPGSRHRVIVYIAEIDPIQIVRMCKKMQLELDSSIGVVTYCDWEWMSDQGTIRLDSAPGCQIEAIREVMDKTIINLINTLKS